MDALPMDYAVSALVTLVVVVEPLGLAPIFLGITQGLPSAIRRRIGLRAALIAAVILAGTAAAGNWLLSQLGISLPAFRIAGGLLLFSIASEMVFGIRFERQFRTAERALEEDVTNMAAFPIAIPLVAGPGAMTATVLLAGQANARPLYVATLLVVIVIVIGLCIAVFEVASRLGSVLGATANIVLSRILGVVLAALSVQFVIDGIRAVFRPW
jgi:multiple antibiotic resistance protein